MGEEELLDLRGVMCPFNFVKTKLKLESMETGKVLAVLLDEGAPMKNVPQSVSNEGHTILSQEKAENFFLVRIQKEDV